MTSAHHAKISGTNTLSQTPRIIYSHINRKTSHRITSLVQITNKLTYSPSITYYISCIITFSCDHIFPTSGKLNCNYYVHMIRLYIMLYNIIKNA